MPRVKFWIGFKALCAKYGDVVYLNILGDHILVLGSARATTELLEKRSANTSDRPSSAVLPLIGNDVAFSIMPYGQWWRDHRRTFWQVFNPSAIREYRDTQRHMRNKFLYRLLESPEEFEHHIRYIFGATVMKIAYGLDAKEKGDELIDRVGEALSCTSDVATGVHPVHLFPFLRHVPGWVPGAAFQYALAKCKAAVDYMKEVPFARMKAALSQGQNTSCTLAVLLSRIQAVPGTPEYAYEEDVVKNVGLVAFEAGSDTSYSTLLGVFLAMSLYPEVQQKAQAELDAVVGRERFPDYEDRDALVYVNALIKEVVRWHVVLPIGLPHRTVEDDVFDGYFIPAGTIIMPNTWAILQDPEEYEQPEEFRPERFIRDGQLDHSVRDPYAFAFGYGRRICAGRYLADDALFLTVASVLHVFNIGPPLDEHGQPIKVKHELKHGLLAYPEDARCTVKPRSAEVAMLISDAC
ncbi:cytochrome P450 [Pilatotrama ljubarskyi]|nr:cytochrome P450 [Pilatotrama ljubarskyi]